MKKTLTKGSSKKSRKKGTKKKSPPKRVTLSRKVPTDETGRPIGWVVKKNGQLETPEEREKRLAKREAMLLRAFQMAYDNYHRK